MEVNSWHLTPRHSAPWRHFLPAVVQAAEAQLEHLNQAAAEAVTQLAEERKRGAVKERKLMDRTHELSKLREQVQEAENSHQVPVDVLTTYITHCINLVDWITHLTISTSCIKSCCMRNPCL